MTLQIEYTFMAGNLFNDTDGIDVRASTDKYTELVEAAIRARYPEAVVNVEAQHGMEGGDGEQFFVFDPDQDDEGMLDRETERTIVFNVEGITAQVFNEGEWYVLTEGEEEPA